MLKQRIITAIILLSLVLVGMFYLPIIWFSIFAALLLSVAAWEYAGLIWQQKKYLRTIFLLLLELFFLGSYFYFFVPILLLAAFWWLVAPFFLIKFSHTQQQFFREQISGLIVGWLLFVPLFVGLLALRYDFGSAYLLYILCIVWAADTGAFFAGKYFGKTALAPALSPKKTVEGAIGGILLALVIGAIGAYWLGVTGMGWLYVLTLVLVAILWSIIGDLFKSMLKRQANVKDSGNILPGHGGVYDRIDSLTSAIPIFALGLMLLGV